LFRFAFTRILPLAVRSRLEQPAIIIILIILIIRTLGVGSPPAPLLAIFCRPLHNGLCRRRSASGEP
jgi:hypothetical protein